VPIYEAAARGKCVPLFKTLLTSHCKNECKYCIFRAGRKSPRMAWEPKKLAEITLHLWKERKIRGLFLSSSIHGDPDDITEKQLETLRILRNRGYTGYIHLRLMPGVNKYLIKESIQLADRVGINLEAPSRDIFHELCPDKGSFKEDIIKRFEWIINEAKGVKKEVNRTKFGFVNAGVDTQMIVGATDDNDLQYVYVTEWLYKNFGLKRVYYSGFEPVAQTPLEKRKPCAPSREYRLYQVSFLLRDYGFQADEITQIANDNGFLPNMDPKLELAKRHSDLFPINLNTASYKEIVRIPSIGPITAKRILNLRKNVKIKYFSQLEQIIGANLARKVAPYVELKDKSLNSFLKVNKGLQR
jgi:predicted DNA-binding helix-hairpin-helix protein